MELVKNVYPNRSLITTKQGIWNMGKEGDPAALIKRVTSRPESLWGRRVHTAEHCDVATLETEARTRARWMTDMMSGRVIKPSSVETRFLCRRRRCLFSVSGHVAADKGSKRKETRAGLNLSPLDSMSHFDRHKSTSICYEENAIPLS